MINDGSSSRINRHRRCPACWCASFATPSPKFGSPQLPSGLLQRAHFWLSHSVALCLQHALGAIIYTVIKAKGIFLLPRIFPSYFMKILQQIFRKNVLRNISWHFSKSNSIFSELPHSMIYDERFRDLSGRLSAEILLPFLSNISQMLLQSSGDDTLLPLRRTQGLIPLTMIFF